MTDQHPPFARSPRRVPHQRSPTAEPIPVPTPRAGTLAAAFDPHRNNLNALRLILAGAVLVSHSWLFVRGEPDPLTRLPGAPDLGTFAVDGFFLLSGFLIIRSHLRAPSTARFLWHRFLRVVPAFWVCLALTAVAIGPLLWRLNRGTTAGYPWTGHDSAVRYLLVNAALKMNQFNIGDLRAGQAVDGPLHTLFFEALCYLMVGVFGTVGILRRRRGLVLTLAVGGWLLAVGGALLGANRLTDSHILKYTAVFLIGAAMFLYADRIPRSRALLIAAAALLAAGLLIPHAYRPLALAPLAYLLLYAGTGRGLSRVGARRDLSYGIYVYAWPLQLLLLEAGVDAGIGTGAVVVHIAASLAVTSLAALASWYAIEAPALALKSWQPPSPRRSTDAGAAHLFVPRSR
ncbi:putative acyltransferase [Frankia casuarinae]|uniref:Acyltransferase 3 n=1 Tax=Frankia casuarinae (strain DSM 45818 / CECT 9043 / HFP020203 / CcI3) TaxID=106370 RepID=Q2JAI7_FRACC|nr:MULTISPECIES: acyltransferase [Frankia]ABD11705.1 acyltransferase 3 [Frankia casuarinae]ETA03464.1 putative acyltransferase [Frankia sp. CcI6]EYT89776.1 putative acyltransferase [Frankia casuarinae]KDA40976.1 putative acyltransferase [Frankia sp. BMG5.23]KEZ34504.1 putative acyltransferase [Frankia sp. CeD]